MTVFTPDDFRRTVDRSFTSARISFLRYGTYAESLLLITRDGEVAPFVSDGRTPFSDGQPIVRRMVEALHAVCAIHLGQFTTRWNPALAKELGLDELGDMPSDLLMVTGHWPAGGVSIVKMAQLIPGPVPDLRDVSIPGMTATGWLTALLPDRERSTS